jgi:hypothetical protein
MKKNGENEFCSPRRKGSLTEGYGFWADDALFDEANDRDKLWPAYMDDEINDLKK